MRVTERFTRVADNADPLQVHHRRRGDVDEIVDGGDADAENRGPLFEFACHETNYGIANILAGARADEQRAAEAAAGGKTEPKPESK